MSHQPTGEAAAMKTMRLLLESRQREKMGEGRTLGNVNLSDVQRSKRKIR